MDAIPTIYNPVLTGARCAGPLRGITPVSTSSFNIFGRHKLKLLPDVQSRMNMAASYKESAPAQYVAAVQQMKIDLVSNYSGALLEKAGIALAHDFSQVGEASLLTLDDGDWKKLVCATLTVEGLSLNSSASSSGKMKPLALSNAFEAVTTNPYQPKLLKHLVFNEPELLLKILVQADIDRLGCVETAAIYEACRCYIQEDEAEGYELLKANVDTQLYTMLKRSFLPELAPGCFENLPDVSSEIRLGFLKQSYAKGGTAEPAELPEGFTFVPGESYRVFDFGDSDLRCLKVLDIGASLCTGCISQLNMYMGLQMTGESDYQSLYQAQSESYGIALEKMRNLTVLVAQSIMRNYLPEFHASGKFDWYQRIVFVAPESQAAKELAYSKKPEVNDKDVLFNTDIYQPRVPGSHGGPWKFSEIDPDTQKLKYETSADWPEVKLPDKLLLTHEELKKYKPPKSSQQP